MDPKLIKAFLISFLFLNLSFLGFPAPLVSQVDPASEWNFLYPKIRDRLISKEEAQHKLKKLEVLLKDFYLKTAPKKSPTHLHLTVHQSKDGYPKPINPYLELIKASRE